MRKDKTKHCFFPTQDESYARSHGVLCQAHLMKYAFIGSRKHDCIARLVMCYFLSLKNDIMIILSCQVLLPDSSKSASDKVGAVQLTFEGKVVVAVLQKIIKHKSGRNERS